jgi:hypothetical protein
MKHAAKQKSDDGFRGLFSLEPKVVFCNQSVSINRGIRAYMRVNNLQCSQLLFTFKFVLQGRKEHDNNNILRVFLIECSSLCSSVLSKRSQQLYGALEYTSAAENKADECCAVIYLL